MAASGMQTLPLLASLSMVMPADDACDEAESSRASALPVCIKNTFIDVIDGLFETRLARRSASAPATPRGQASSAPCVFDASALSSLSPKAWSAASTVANSTAGDSEELDISEDGSEASVTSDPEDRTRTLADLLPAPQVSLRTKLTTRAKAWTPSRRMSIPAIPPEIKSQFSEITAAVQAQLMRCGAVQQVETLQHGTDWSVVGSCQPLDFVHAQQGLELVKQAMLSAAEQSMLSAAVQGLELAKQAMLSAAVQSNNIYVIGYEASPFHALSTGLGFCAQLAMVDDDASACWDLLAKGHCCRGCNCRWQHPKWQVSLKVAMKYS